MTLEIANCLRGRFIPADNNEVRYNKQRENNWNYKYVITVLEIAATWEPAPTAHPFSARSHEIGEKKGSSEAGNWF